VYVLINIYKEPSFSQWASKLTIVYVVLCNVAGLCAWAIGYGFLPFHNYEQAMHLDKLKEEAPGEYDRIMKEAVEAHSKRHFFIRWFTWPKVRLQKKPPNSGPGGF